MKNIVISLFLVSVLYAETSPKKPILTPLEEQSKIAFKEYDINSDQKVSYSEVLIYEQKKRDMRAKEEIDRVFLLCDKNSDEKISKDEISSTLNINKLMQNNKDISKECLFSIEMLEAEDINNDGFVSKKEALKLLHPTIKQRKKIAKNQKVFEKKQENQWAIQRFKECDKNNDKSLTLREATSRKCGMNSDDFFIQDHDKDEALSRAEMLDTKEIHNKNKIEMLNREAFKEAPPREKFDIGIYMCDENEDRLLSKEEAFHGDCGLDATLFKKYDTNKDNMIDNDEHLRMNDEDSFLEFDINKDGFLNMKEFSKTYYRSDLL